MKVALFSHNFLEPTHHAIAAVLSELREHQFSVFGKTFSDQECFRLNNVVARTIFQKNCLAHFKRAEFKLAHIIYDGGIAFDAADVAVTAEVPFILSFHGGFDTKAKIQDPIYTSRTRRIAEQAKLVTVSSKSDLRRLESLRITGNVRFVPVPVDFQQLPSPAPRQQMKLISIGRLIEKKGIDVALKTLSLLPSEYSLNIIGEGPLEKPLQELSNSLGLVTRVKWLGLCTLQKTLQTLNECGVLLHAASSGADGNAEGTPQAILWAQAIGVPVVSTYSGDIPDIVKHNQTGLLVQPDDPSALAEAIATLAASDYLAERIVLQARQQVLSVHSLATVGAHWRALYRSVAGINHKA